MANDEQSRLIAVLKQRDDSGWSAAVDCHLHEVNGFAFHLVGGDRAVAEDLNQETWLEAVGGIDHCDAARGSFRNWLFGIARKRVALRYRRRALVGKDVKLGTPDRPIFWYKPTGADKYRVIHADLSVKEMTTDDVKKLLEAKAG